MNEKDTTAKKPDDTVESIASKQQNVQVIDVSHPGKSAPSATSRPVIVGSGSYMKDPMVSRSSAKDDTDADDAPSSNKPAVGDGGVIQSLGGIGNAKSNEEDTEELEQLNNDTNKQVDEAATDASTESSAEANNQAGSDTRLSAGNSGGAVVDAKLGQTDEKGNAVEDLDQTDNQINQLIQEKKYFVSVSKPNQSYGSLIVSIVSIIVIITTIVVLADAYDVISLL